MVEHRVRSHAAVFRGLQGTARAAPLIYDNLVATAVIRLLGAPLLPSVWERHHGQLQGVPAVRCWADQTAAAHRTDLAVVEWAPFSLGRK